MIKTVFYFFISLFSTPIWAVNVTFILPDYKEHQFWYLVADAAKSAANDSEVSLTITHIDNNRFAFNDAVIKALSSDERPEYIVFRPFQGRMIEMYNLLEEKQVKFITLEKVATGTEAEAIGEPLEKYQYWLGEIFYNQTSGSELLTNALIHEHKLKQPNQITYITGLSGSYDAVTKMRNDGLRNSESENKNTYINQIFTMNFDSKLVKERFSNIVQRYPNTNIFWCASAQMAVEVVKQLNEFNLLNKQHIITGGFDFIPSALEMVKKGEITALVGGHFLMGAKAVIQIMNNHKGMTAFKQINRYELVTINNVTQYQEFISNEKWHHVDFSHYLFDPKNSNKSKEVNVSNLIKSLENK